MSLSTTTELLTAIRVQAGSDRKAAPLFGVTQATFSDWRNGDATPTDDHALRIAELLALDEAYVLAVVRRDRAKSARARAAWSRIAEAFGKAAILAVFTATPFIAPPPAGAGSHNQNYADPNTHCATTVDHHASNQEGFQ